MRPNLAGQRQQPFRNFSRHVFERHVLGDRSALLAALDVRTETSALEQYPLAQLGRAIALRLVPTLSELLRVLALRVVGAGDERPELAAAQAEPAVAALRADARVTAVGSRRI